MPRVKLFDREEVLKKAMELFWEKGYASTSLSDLTTHLDIGKGSFYATFNSKQALFEEAFDLYRGERVNILGEFLDSEPDVKTGVRKFLVLSLEEFLNDDKRKGCMVTNTCSDYAGIGKKMENKLVEHNLSLRQVLVNYIERSQVSTKKAESIAATILTFLIGMSQEVKFKKDEDLYLQSIDMLVGLLD